jgi:hypothetical protein
MNFATKGDFDDVPMKWMKFGKEWRLDFNPKEWKKCATKGDWTSLQKVDEVCNQGRP